MDNYRPISVLPVASKILERAVQIQLLQHLDKSSQLSPFQCGFRKNHSTQDAVTYFTDCIRKGIDEGCVTAAVFVDFRKAFDSVNHQLLLNKLPGYGISNHELRWLKNYLTSRWKSGVPQGSILGPIFVFDLHQWLAQLLTSVKDATSCGRCCLFQPSLQYRKHKYHFE